MYLSDKDLKDAIEKGELLCSPPPTTFDPTSIDLHLDQVHEARIWGIDKYVADEAIRGSRRPELRIGQYKYALFAEKYLSSPPAYDDTSAALVQLRSNQVIVRPSGFLLWQTKERVGTPHDAKLICFVNGKSTRARAGIVVHLTAPTMHSTWAGKITLEIANVGPFDLVLQEDDVIAQLTVARITSTPDRSMSVTSTTHDQASVDAAKR